MSQSTGVKVAAGVVLIVIIVLLAVAGEALLNNSHHLSGETGRVAILPLDASSVEVSYSFMSATAIESLPPINVRSPALLHRLTSELDDPDVVAHIPRGTGCEIPGIYDLLFRFSRRRPLDVTVGRGWAQSDRGTASVTMPLAYDLAGILRHDTRARRPCRQYWRGNRLRICQKTI